VENTSKLKSLGFTAKP